MQSGWTFVSGDNQLGFLPFVPGSFKPFAGGGADGIISARPAGYPALDFYGVSIPATNASAGAVQTIAGGYFLDYAEQGPGTVTLSAGSPDEDNLYSGSVTFMAAANPSKQFLHWIVNEAALPEQPTPAELTITMDGHKTVRGVFGVIWDLNNADSGTGSLREALTGAADGDIMRLPANQTITLATPLPPITTSITLEGNGATLTRSFGSGSNTQLLRITSGTAKVNINRLHFKEGRAANYGAAIYSAGILVLESCIFSDNQTGDTGAFGGAIYSFGGSANLTVSGSSFYGNTAGTTGGKGGAIYRESGALALTGNVFWGNTANTAPVVYHDGGAISGGYNVSDRASGYADDAASSGWIFAAGDAQGISPPLNAADFKPFSNGAAYQAMSTRPEGYPAEDFYGVSIPSSNAMSGAAQEAIITSGYYLNYAAQGSGTVTPSGSQDAYGFYTGSVTLTGAGAGLSFGRWIVDGVIQGPQSPVNEIVISMNGHKTVRGVFFREATDTTTLSNAIQNAVDGDVIVLPSAGTITLTAVLPEITKSIAIEGNGATLTQSGITPSNTSQLLRITSSAAEVTISRLHFKGGRAEFYSAAINTEAGILTLESCIFSDNVNSGNFGGAIYANGKTTISGCTFYGNTANNYGGAICASNTSTNTLTLTGNLFWENTANISPVVLGPGLSKGYNVSDTPSDQSGWTFVTGDTLASSLPLNPGDFKPLSNGAAYQIIAVRPEGYPTVDFHGAPVPSSNAMSGAIQTPMTPTGYYLDYANVGPGQVTVKTGSGSGGFYTGTVTLEATPDFDYLFMRWIVDGQVQDPQSPANELTFVMNDHKVVRAVFGLDLTVTSGADDLSSPGTGTLRWAVNNAGAGDTITITAGQAINLAGALTINKSLDIEGNGSTLTQSGSSRLLSVSSAATVHISRLLFKGGRLSSGNGAAIDNSGTLTLESCIFYDNKTGTSSSSGGAINASGTLTVLGCTFFENIAGTTGISRGGAINASGSVSLTGNIFAGNTARYSHVVYRSGGTTSNGYNVTDKESGVASGTNTTQTGWTFSTTDIQLTDVTFTDAGGGDFTPSSVTGLPVISTLPAVFPTTYFDGTSRGSNSTPGAMPLGQ
jgi:predicted outer membrane repeat protein